LLSKQKGHERNKEKMAQKQELKKKKMPKD